LSLRKFSRELAARLQGSKCQDFAAEELREVFGARSEFEPTPRKWTATTTSIRPATTESKIQLARHASGSLRHQDLHRDLPPQGCFLYVTKHRTSNGWEKEEPHKEARGYGSGRGSSERWDNMTNNMVLQRRG